MPGKPSIGGGCVGVVWGERVQWQVGWKDDRVLVILWIRDTNIREEVSQFCAGVLFLMSYFKQVVPFLQDDFWANATNMKIMKYTLYSCYDCGTTANANTSPIAFAILFGNEGTAGWEEFWQFALSLHPLLNYYTKRPS